MKSNGKGKRIALLIAVVAAMFAVATRSEAGSRKIAKELNAAAIEVYGENDGPGYLIAGLAPTFQYPYISNFNSMRNDAESMGSEIWLIRNGVIVAAEEPELVRFVGDDPISVVGDFADAIQSGFESTFLGSYREPLSGVAHVVTPTPEFMNSIPHDVQEACANASRMFDEALLMGQLGMTVSQGGITTPTTTVALATFIKLYGGPGGTQSDVDVNDILEHLFVPDIVMSCNSPCVAEGDLFGHEPTDDLFFYTSRLDSQNGKTTVQLFVGRKGVADFKPNSDNNVINLGANGVEPIALLTETNADGDVVFDPVNELDRDTIVATAYDKDGFPIAELQVDVDKSTVGYFDGDDTLDLQIFFKTAELAEIIEVEQVITINIVGYTKVGNMPVKFADTAKVVPAK